MKWWPIGILIVVLLVLISPLASSAPDGLERVAEDKGFIEQAQGAPFEIIADYIFPGIGNEALATILAGAIGAAIIFGMVYGISRLVRAKAKRSAG